MNAKLNPFFFCALLCLSVLFGCQKSSDNQLAPKAATDTANVAADKKIVPENVCSDTLKNSFTQSIELQKRSAQISDQLRSKKNNSNLQSDYRSVSDLRVENCRQLEEKFNQQKISACLKSTSGKSIENSIYLTDVTENCKSIGLWAKTVSHKDNTYTESKKSKLATFKFSEQALDLVKSAGNSTAAFIANGEIKSGKDSFRQSVQSTTPTCYMTTPVSVISDDLNFEYLSDISNPDPTTDIGFEFNGSRTVIVLKDSNDAIHSILCLNLKLTTEKDISATLKKVFGSKILIIGKRDNVKLVTEIADSEKAKLLNQEVAPTTTPTTPLTTQDQKPENQGEAGQTKSTNSAISQNPVLTANIDKVTEKIKEVTDHGIDKMTEATTKVIIESKKAGIEVIEKAESSANAVAKQAIKETKLAIIETIKAPFVAIDEFFYRTGKSVTDSIKSWFTTSPAKAPKTKTQTPAPASK